MTKLSVALEPRLSGEGGEAARIRRCPEIFEDFCVVTESVRSGLPVEVRVQGLDLPAAEPVP